MISIIITHHKTPELLHVCVESIKKTFKDCEIIICDSEADKKIDIKDVQVLSFKKNTGYAFLVNQGIKKSKGEYVLILNADIVVLEDSIQKMLNYMEKYEKIGILGPQLIDFTGNIQISCFAYPTISSIVARRTPFKKLKRGKNILNKFTIKEWDRTTTREVDWIQGSAIMVRKKAIDKIGLMDERFFMYFEDVDWCRRFWQKGYKVVYYSKARMAHYYHRASKKFGAILDVVLNKQSRIHIYSALKYFKKWKYVK
ncbi:glycosyltransferase family 2 protein [Patescibacteria group bacterium]|nr:glycosyltransferase family 2 protein [Patescibacteria group bacterium]MBU3923241.1 glycosyltransferase family 2 protein [Patescibacteria group bacterium]